MATIFWANNPSALIDSEHVTEIWPSTDMHYVSKLNAISRLTILLTILGYIATQSKTMLMTGIATIVPL